MTGFQSLRQQTCLKKYGVDSYSKTEDFKSKVIQSSQKRWGVDNPFQSEDIKSKIQNTMVERYNKSHPMLVPEIRNRWKETCFKIHGTYPWLTSESKEKVVATLQARYGVGNFSQAHIKALLPNLQSQEWWDKFSSIGSIILELESHLAISNIYIYINRYRPDLIGTGFIISKPHQQIIDFLNKHQIEHQVNTRSIIPPLELDIYIPSHSLAVEVNGVYWHSAKSIEEIPQVATRHQTKTLRCLEQGISLIQVTDIDVKDRFSKIEQLLAYRLLEHEGQEPKPIGARQCSVRILDTSQAKTFCIAYHFDGYANSQIKLGLFYLDELVAVMTFSRSRFGNSDWEVVRACSRKPIAGGVSKLIKHFMKTIMKPKETLSTYVNLSLGFTGNGYQQAGMSNIKTTEPGYVWIDNQGTVFSRYQMQPRNLSKRFEDYSGETENHFLFKKGFMKYYDSGNRVFLIEK